MAKQGLTFWKLMIACCFIILTSYTVRHVPATTPKVLIYCKTTRYHHESIPAGIAAIKALGRQHEFSVDTTTNALAFTTKNLKQYAAIIFLSPSGNSLSSSQQSAFKQFIQSGGGFGGIHSAAAAEKDWPWYGQLVGAVFTDHPDPQQGYINVQDHNDPSTRHLPERWSWRDEWYNFRELPTNVHVLLCADEASYTGGNNGPYHPLSWYHHFDGGRAFYTALGHFSSAYSDPLFTRHLLGGIQYALGNTGLHDRHR